MTLEHRQASGAHNSNLDRWRVSKKMRPGERGAVKLSRAHGPQLLCVRYRESPNGHERLTTIELVVERVPVQKREDPIVVLRIAFGETTLRQEALERGGKWDSALKLWKLRLSAVRKMGLEQRIVHANKLGG